jgi:ectoine hydroxylase-related dioxygenase (phytanoyl-CoA dioxygenase family)
MKNGYEIIENFLTEEEHNHYLDVCERLNRRIHFPGDRRYYSWNTPSNINKVMSACNYEPEFLKLASHPTLVKRAKELLNTKDTIDVYISKFFPMIPKEGISTKMHQDNYYFNGNPKKIISCAVYLNDTTKENGCLRLVEDSHTRGILPHDIESGIPYIKWIDDKHLEDYNIIDLELKSPYTVFFDINMVHGCYENKSDNNRYSLAWEYIETSNTDVQMSPHVDRNTTIG